MLKQISSTQNPRIKELIKLKDKSRQRKKSSAFLIEGLRECELAIKGSYEIEELFFNPSIISLEKIKARLGEINATFIELSSAAYQVLAHRESTEGIIAFAKFKPSNLNELKFENNTPLILVAEAPEKPGNIGALLRTADAAGIDAVLIANSKTDLYNPNIIRSSVGTVFTTKVVMESTSEIIGFLKKNNINIYCAALSASVDYTTINYKTPTAIVVGTEATGLSDEWLQHSTKNIIIPMRGNIDSMNVSVSAGILIFEAIRQRYNTNI
jgi:TrmH family RNA methyltransferase